jgi:hypothetical protein
LFPEGGTLSVKERNGKLTCELTAENEYYEHASYNVTTHYEPGLLELDAVLDEKSLRERAGAKVSSVGLFGGLSGIGFGGLAANSLLGTALNRPREGLKIVLVPGEPDTLFGLQAIKPSGGLEKSQSLLGAKELRVTRRTSTG